MRRPFRSSNVDWPPAPVPEEFGGVVCTNFFLRLAARAFTSRWDRRVIRVALAGQSLYKSLPRAVYTWTSLYEMPPTTFHLLEPTIIFITSPQEIKVATIGVSNVVTDTHWFPDYPIIPTRRDRSPPGSRNTPTWR